MDKVKKNQKRLAETVIVHVLVITFGMSTWIGVNGIFIQLPLLVQTSPEGWRLAAYLAVAVQAANVAPLIYSFLHRFSLNINESKCILGMLGIGCSVMGLMPFFYDKTSTFAGSEHSTALLVLTFFISMLGCISSVLFMPYMKNFKEIYLVSYFVGEGLSGVVPSIVALVQGIGEDPACNNNTEISGASEISSPRFSLKYYFLFIFACLLLSLVAFLLLKKLFFVKKERGFIPRYSDNSSDVNDLNCCHKYGITLSEGLATECEIMEKHVDIDENERAEVKGLSSENCSTREVENSNLENLYLYVLLGVICIFANGLLLALQPYSSMSYGNKTYHLSATLSLIANPAACFLALRFLPHSRKLINFISAAIFVEIGYVALLALSSPDPPLRDTKIGKAMVVFLWISLMGLIAYVRLMITSVFRRKSEKTLFYVGLVTQIGSACGAVLSIFLINFTTLLKEYKKCSG